MQTERKRAMVACLNGVNARRFAYLLNEAGFEVAGAVTSARDILLTLREHRPDVLLSESILPGGDGTSLAQAVAGASLNRYPCILLTPTGGFPLPRAESLRDFGATLLDGPLTAQAIADAVDALEARATLLPPVRGAQLQCLMDRLGIPPHPGREMLANAVALVWRDRGRLQNLRDRVYPDAARPLGKSGAHAERAIRHAIDVAWRTGEIDEQQRIFGDTIDARRGRPTCSEMIAQLADILRWEG